MMEYTKEESILIRRLEELSKTAYYKTVCCYSDFLNLNEQSIFHQILGEIAPVSFSMFGGYKDAERKMICFHGDCTDMFSEKNGMDFQDAYPITCLEIKPANLHFTEALSHRDYLGAVMNLGIERSRIGDILLSEHTAYLYCDSSLAGFISEQLNKVRHTTMRTAIHSSDFVPERCFEMLHSNVASLRLDAVIGAAFCASRSSMAELIPAGKVFVNGRQCLSCSYLLKPGEIVSVRGHGKFCFEGQGSLTKKGRINISIRKYT